MSAVAPLDADSAFMVQSPHPHETGLKMTMVIRFRWKGGADYQGFKFDIAPPSLNETMHQMAQRILAKWSKDPAAPALPKEEREYFVARLTAWLSDNRNRLAGGAAARENPFSFETLIERPRMAPPVIPVPPPVSSTGRLEESYSGPRSQPRPNLSEPAPIWPGPAAAAPPPSSPSVPVHTRATPPALAADQASPGARLPSNVNPAKPSLPSGPTVYPPAGEPAPGRVSKAGSEQPTATSSFSPSAFAPKARPAAEPLPELPARPQSPRISPATQTARATQDREANGLKPIEQASLPRANATEEPGGSVFWLGTVVHRDPNATPNNSREPPPGQPDRKPSSE